MSNLDLWDVLAVIFFVVIIALIVILTGVIIYETVNEKPSVSPVCDVIDLWKIDDVYYIRMTEQESAEYCK